MGVVAFRTNIAYARYEEGMDCLEVLESLEVLIRDVLEYMTP